MSLFHFLFRKERAKKARFQLHDCLLLRSSDTVTLFRQEGRDPWDPSHQDCVVTCAAAHKIRALGRQSFPAARPATDASASVPMQVIHIRMSRVARPAAQVPRTIWEDAGRNGRGSGGRDAEPARGHGSLHRVSGCGRRHRKRLTFDEPCPDFLLEET